MENLKEKNERKEEIKEFILSKDTSDKYHLKKVIIGSNDMNSYILDETIVSEKIMKLINDYDAIENKREPNTRYKIEFESYDECNLEEKQKIREMQVVRKKRFDEILSDKTGKYDKKEKIKIPLYERDSEGYYLKTDEIELELTVKELAECGILLEDLEKENLRNDYTSSIDKKIKRELFEKKDNSEYYCETTRKVDGFLKGYIKSKKPISGKIMRLINDHNAFKNKFELVETIPVEDIKPGIFDNYYEVITFKSYEECNEEEKKLIDEKREVDKKKLDEILSDKSEKYDKKGKIFIPFYRKRIWDPKDLKKFGKIQIEVTERELAEYGIVPEDMNWKSMEQIEKEQKEAKKRAKKEKRRGKVSSKDIASASKNLPSKNVKGIGWVIKSLIKDLFNSKE